MQYNNVHTYRRSLPLMNLNLYVYNPLLQETIGNSMRNYRTLGCQ